MSPPPAPVDPKGRIPLAVKLAYGAPSFASAALVIPISIHLTIFYTDTVLVPLGFVALVKALARSFDAVTDPVMGWLTDHTRSRWGRRRPWIALGVPLAAVSFYGMFAPPESLSGTAAGVWLLITYAAYYLFHTIYIIPHYGLGAEMSEDHHERSRLFAVREAFVIGGTLCAAVAPPLLIGALGGARGGYAGFALLFGGLLILLYGILVWRVPERREFQARPSNPLVPGLRRTLRNRAFRPVLAAYLVGASTAGIPALLSPYWIKYVLQPENPDAWIGIVLAIYFGAGFAALPLWLKASVKFGKRRTWIASFVPAAVGASSLFFLGKGDFVALCVLTAFFGTAFGPQIFLIQSILADLIDYDELQYGRRREAQYAAFWSFLAKFMVIPSASIPLAILASSGYVPNVPQSESVIFTIRAMYGLLPAGANLIALVLAFRYPITGAMHHAIINGIAARNRGEAAPDPLTGQELPAWEAMTVDQDKGWYLDHFSPKELARSLVEGPTALVRGAAISLAFAGVALATFVAGAWLAIGDASTEPGLAAVLTIVASGLSFAACAFHARRLSAARGWHEEAISIETLKDHLRHLERPG